MSEMIVREVHFYLNSILSGMIIVAAYDILRILRRIIPHKSFWVGVQDLIFWIASSFFIFQMIYRFNSGRIRIPGILVMVLGMVIYHYGISVPVVDFLTRRIIVPIKKGIGVLFRGLKKFGKKVKMSLVISKKQKQQ